MSANIDPTIGAAVCNKRSSAVSVDDMHESSLFTITLSVVIEDEGSRGHKH